MTATDGCKQVLIAGFGSIGRRHAANLMRIGIKPFVLTKYPDGTEGVKFLAGFDEVGGYAISHAVICSATWRHLHDFEKLAKAGIKNILIEKPVAESTVAARKIAQIAEEKKLNVHVAYNIRYLGCMDIIKRFLSENANSVKIVNICIGQNLTEWRPGTDYRQSYSAMAARGGGAELDLSHEIDYMLWLFGKPQSKNIFKAKISSLEIDSNDIFCGSYYYRKSDAAFIVIVELDYIRRDKKRTVEIICENGKRLFCDLFGKRLEISGINCETTVYVEPELFDLKGSYVKEMKDFLSESVSDNLATLPQSINVLNHIEE